MRRAAYVFSGFHTIKNFKSIVRMICPADSQSIYRLCLPSLHGGCRYHQLIDIIGDVQCGIECFQNIQISWIIVIVKIIRICVNFNIRVVVADFITTRVVWIFCRNSVICAFQSCIDCERWICCRWCCTIPGRTGCHCRRNGGKCGNQSAKNYNFFHYIYLLFLYYIRSIDLSQYF